MLDGGHKDIASASFARDVLGAKKITTVITSPLGRVPSRWKSKWPHLLSFGVRAVDIMTTEILINDVKNCGPEVDMRVIAPDDFIDLDQGEVDHEKWEYYYQDGYHKANNVLGDA